MKYKNILKSLPWYGFLNKIQSASKFGWRYGHREYFKETPQHRPVQWSA